MKMTKDGDWDWDEDEDEELDEDENMVKVFCGNNHTWYLSFFTQARYL